MFFICNPGGARNEIRLLLVVFSLAASNPLSTKHLFCSRLCVDSVLPVEKKEMVFRLGICVSDKNVLQIFFVA